MRLAVIVPFLNEAPYLGTLLRSLEVQTRPPDRLLLVDDGSTDGSGEIARAYAAGRSSVGVLRRPSRDRAADRLAGAHELRAFAWALSELEEPWDVVAKLDADLELTPRTLETLVTAFGTEPRLGLAGTFLREAGADGTLRRLRIASDHVHGATKFYRRACWQEIAPLPPILGWDTIDEVTARLHGWRTVSLEVPGGDPVHLRPRGGQDGMLRAYRRWGECAWGIGEAPLHVALMALRQTRQRPRVLGGVSYAAGWARA
ncbi:MAG: glycosyltransferase, partial [Actinomycetota bacterium]|nr:glycosyltransferase [Actinomycetota bacterium]